ncbi:MAG: hypothetical protein AAF620_08930 [Bacteroidota bacterium]
MYKFLIVFISIFLIHKSLHAQNSNIDGISSKSLNDHIGVSVGYNQGYFKDLLFSPLNYIQGGALYGLRYVRQSPNDKNLIELNMQYSSGELNVSDLDNFTASYLFGKFKLGYLHRISLIKRNNLKVYLGGEYQTQIHSLEWLDASVAASWFGTHGLRVKALASYQIQKRHQVQTALSIPVFQSLVRPPFNVRDEFVDENQDNILAFVFRGESASLDKYFAIDWETSYYFELSKRLDMLFTYQMIYQRVFDVHRLIQFQNQLNIGVSFKF